MTDPMTRLDAEETRLLTELAEVRAAKATLRRLCGLADPPRGAQVVAEPHEPTPGKAEARPSPAAGRTGRVGPGYTPAGRKADPERLGKVLAALATGPLTSEQLGKRVDCSAITARTLCLSWPNLIQKPNGNRKAPWELTEAGRAAAASAG